MNVSLRAAVDADFEACRRTYFAEMDWVNERLGLKRDEQESMFRKLWDPAQVCIIQADGIDVGWLQTVVSKTLRSRGGESGPRCCAGSSTRRLGGGCRSVWPS